MKIYSMTATFGKLENQTLRLEPGLNVISAPNEWGKTTWCAFLVTMLYGLDTREKTTKAALAVKERYAPWSGSPMSGRMDIHWNGRDITIERWTKGRTPMGEFRAYETESGLIVPELTAANCGETLLGVEKSVFVRAGFLRLADLPVTADDSLRRRLNALVTTGDDSGAGDALAQKLKDLKNKCRYNRSGLLPQAESQKKELEDKLAQLHTLRAQTEALQQQNEAQEARLADLENHRVALRYAAAQENIRRVEQANRAVETAAQTLAGLEDLCAGQVSREAVLAQLQTHARLQQTQAALLQQKDALPPEPIAPQIPRKYWDLTPQEMTQQADSDVRHYESLEEAKKKTSLLWLAWGAVAGILLVIGVISGTQVLLIGGIILSALSALGVLCLCRMRTAKISGQIRKIMEEYPGIRPQDWQSYAQSCAEAQQQYRQSLAKNRAMAQENGDQLQKLQAELASLTGNMEPQSWVAKCNAIVKNYDALTDARRAYRSAADHAAALQAMVKPVSAPEKADVLTLTETETENAVAQLKAAQKQQQQLLGQYQGKMATLGSAQELQNQLDAVHARIQRLELTYRALEMALQTLEKATAELQRRFAPRITDQARGLFEKLTGGRYDRMTWQQDLTVHAASVDEIALHSAQWRSEGTVDQLYLALRLAVARELTPHAPLVLDDVLVRFDDQRHAAAMEILAEEAENKQVILFTCQNRS